MDRERMFAKKALVHGGGYEDDELVKYPKLHAIKLRIALPYIARKPTRDLFWTQMEWHPHIFTELARFFSYLALVVHHPSEVCHIHPLPLQFLHSLLNTCIPESGFELYVAFNNPSNGFLRCSPALCQFKSLPR